MQTHSRTTIWRGAILLTLAFAACFSLSSMAETKDPPWIAKDWTQWNTDDCDAVLTKSPWGLNTSEASYMSTSGPKVSTTDETIVQLRSALPIRQALLREIQMDQSYDRMKPDKKQVFDQAHVHDLDPSDQILVYIKHGVLDSLGSGASGRTTYTEPASHARQAVLRLFRATLIQPIETTVLMNGQYGNEIQYSFPRMVGGKPVTSPTDTSLVIEIGAPLLISIKSGRFDQPAPFQDSGHGYTFKIADMMYKGKLEY
jgi:hypothetical protein